MMLLLAICLCSCGKINEPDDGFPNEEQNTETVSDEENTDEGTTLESVPEEPYIYYPYGTPAPEGINNMPDKPMLIERANLLSYEELSEAYTTVTKTAETFINTSFNFDFETSSDFTEDIQLLMYDGRKFDFDKNIFTELKNAKVKSKVKDIHHVAVVEMDINNIVMLCATGYFDADIEISLYNGGEGRLPYYFYFIKDDNGKWKIVNFEIQNVYSRKDEIQMYLYKNEGMVFDVSADNGTDLLFCFDFSDPDGFISGYEQGDVEFAEKGTYVIKDEDGNIEVLTDE